MDVKKARHKRKETLLLSPTGTEKRVRDIVKQPGIYQQYESALSSCVSVVEAPPLEQALVLSMWLFGTWEGALVLAHSLLQGLDSVRLPPECLAASTHRISHDRFRSASSSCKDVCQWETILPELPMSAGAEGFFLVTSTLGTLLTAKPNMSIRTTASYIREAGILCPWGASTNGHLMIQIKKLDVRAKQALASLIAGNHFTNSKESVLTRLPIADGYRWNDATQKVMAQWKPLVVTAFMRVCLDTAETVDGREAAVAVMNRTVAHLSRTFPNAEYLISPCWHLASQTVGTTEEVLQMLEERLEKDIGYSVTPKN